MNDDPKIPYYVLESLHGLATDEQKTLTQIWLTEPANKLAFDQMKKISSLSGDIKLFEKFDLREGKTVVCGRIRKNKQIRIFRNIQKVAALFLIPALAYASWSFHQNKLLKKDLATVQVTQEMRTQPGVRTSFSLPDGTRVWLNSASTIRFPSVFSHETRSIELSGEAYFEVAKNDAKPFVVKSGALHLTALGTAFNLCAYPGDDHISATLAEGKVKISMQTGKHEDYMLEPDEQLTFENKTREISKTRVNVDDVIAWKDGKLIFNETPFQDVVRKLSRWFNTDITLADASMANYRYTATFTNENLAQVMELLTYSAPIEFTATSRTIQQDKGFSPKQIIIRVKPGLKQKLNQKNELPMKQ